MLNYGLDNSKKGGKKLRKTMVVSNQNQRRFKSASPPAEGRENRLNRYKTFKN